MKRRDWLKAITAGSLGIAGVGGLSVTAFAQDGDVILAEFCGPASTPPDTPPGGQAGQCISCVRAVCENEPVALEPLFTGLSGTCFTIPVEDIPEDANYLTLKTGQNCFLADEIPLDAEGSVTWCLPAGSQEISNATFYACDMEEPPTADVVKVCCDAITISTTNIPDGETLSVTVDFSGAPSENYTPTVTDGQATVSLPGTVDPTHITITYGDGMLLYDADITAEDGPCKKRPECPDLCVTYKFKDCKWVPKSGDATELAVEGDQSSATICAPFPFVVTYATRPKGTTKTQHDGTNSDRDEKHDCKTRERVCAEPADGTYVATIPAHDDTTTDETCLCWFRVQCPDNENDSRKR